jgi:integrase
LQPEYETRLKVQLSNTRSRANELWYLGCAFGKIGAGKPVAQISKADVLRMLDAISVKSKANARHALSALGRFLDWCGGERSIVTENVVRGVPRGRVPAPPNPRERVLSLAECALLWNGVANLDDLPRRLMRLLLALPLRRGELIQTEWSWLDRKAKTLTLPGQVMKNRELHRLPLGPLTLAILDEQAGGEKWPAKGRLFATGNARCANWSWLKRVIDKAVPLEQPWTFHDTRRAFVTGLAEAGISEVVCDSLIAHRQSSTRRGVLAVYQKAAHWPAQVTAMARWHTLLAGAITGERGEVVQFPAAG